MKSFFVGSKGFLTNPKTDNCSQCGIKSDTIRKYNCSDFQNKFCHGCWFDYLHDCSVHNASWVNKVSQIWEYDVPVILIPLNVT